jgi:putative ABC transport system permease protein
MKTLRRFFRRLISPVTSTRDEEFLRAEFDEHVAMQAAEFVRAGMSPDEARRQALLKFGSVEAIKESYRDQRSLPWLETLARDTRHALRRLRKNPAFTVSVVLTLALGIGANTAIFGVIESVLIRPLPYPDAEALVGVWHTAPGMSAGNPRMNCSPSMYFTYRDENRTFQHFGVWRFGVAPVTGAGEPELPRTLMVTHGVLDALDVKPLLGRWFSQADDTPGTPETVILTHGYWRRRFLGDTSVIGRAMTINARPRTVIGVMPESFEFSRNAREPELILPLRLERPASLGTFAFQGIARLRPGVTLTQANADLARMLEVWLRSWPSPRGLDIAVFRNARFGPQIQPLKQEIVGNAGTMLWVVMGTLALVLLIACANVASLLLVDAEVRGPELAVRAALGAGWRRIAGQLLAESVTLGMLGGALGLGPAYVGLKILAARGPSTLPRLNEIQFDPWVLAFAFGASVFSGVLAGIIPLAKYSRPPAAALRTVGRTFSQTRERHRARNTLVVVQVALALVLLVGAGLMIRTFQQLRAVQPGFTLPDEIHIVRSSIPEAIAKEPTRAMRMWQEILDKIAAIPGVTSVGLAGQVPLEAQLGYRNRQRLDAERPTLEGRPGNTSVEMRLIAPSFFETMGTRIIAGRDFTWADLYEHRHVAIVSDNLARAWWGGPRAALGQRVRETSIAPWREVVGVVEDVYDDGVHIPAPEFAYLPALMDRHLVFDREFVLRDATFAIRSERAGTESLLGEARNAIWSVNGRQPVFSFVSTVGQLYDQSMARTSFILVILAIVGGMALLLGIVGIYGVIAYAVSQRTREIGLRMALGAQPATMLPVFIRQGLLLAAIGVGVGLAAAVGLTRLMSSLLFGVSAVDPLTYAAVSALLMAAAVLASYVPARRAMAIDPVEALRAE